MKHPGSSATQQELVDWGDKVLASLTNRGPDRILINPRGDTIPLNDAKFLPTRLEISCVVVGTNGESLGCEEHNRETAEGKVGEVGAVARRLSVDQVDGEEHWKWALDIICNPD